jgi:hypothetical protein
MNSPLPFQNVSNNRDAQIKRNIIQWFVPQVGLIKMFCNPTTITYPEKKNINRERTKGGFSIGYFGEELMTLSITGNTASSGIEGINVLREIYRAEQYLFDNTSMLINAANTQALTTTVTDFITNNNNVSNLVNTTNGALGLSSLLNMTQLNPRNISTLADVAFGIEMYYSGWVFRGYFEGFTLTENTDFVYTYNMTFVVTQRRGYRLNSFAFQHSPTEPSAYDNKSSYDTSKIKV